MSSDSIQTTILVILMAADPKVLSVEEILKDTVNGVTEQEISEGLNDLFDKGWVQPFNPHPRNADRPSAMLTAAGKSHLKLLVMKTYAEVLRDMETPS
jgi:predicted transcriptional regulator